MFADYATAVSLAIALAAVFLTLGQARLSRKALQAQSYINLEALEVETGYRDGMRTITTLNHYDSYDAFRADTADAQKTEERIYNAISFLNFVAHLVDEGYLSRDAAWRIYVYNYRSCVEKGILTWWLPAWRQNHPGDFTLFERMCAIIQRTDLTGWEKHGGKGKLG
jgi:hypothetical protein